MSGGDMSSMARLTAERIMRGETISDGEMRMVVAGLLLSVEKLTDALVRVESGLWSEDRLKAIIAEQVEKHCAARSALLHPQVSSSDSASWVGRLIRTVFGR
jgi:hypothetical protein